MPFELESLVGHLYIMGKRVLKTTPPGVLVEVAPSKAARGREADTFFALVLPSGTVAPNTFYEQMAQMAAERFFNTGGSVTAALRDVLNMLNNNLFEHNQSGRTHYEANMLCAVLRGEEITIARVGAAAAVIRAGDQTVSYPEDLTADEALFQPPLGVQPIPAVFLKRFSIEAGARFVLSDASLAEIPLAKIDQALRASNLEQVLSEFKMLVTLQIQLMAVELVRAEEPVPLPVVMGESTTAIAAELAAQRQQAAPITAEPEQPAPCDGGRIKTGGWHCRRLRRAEPAGIGRSGGQTFCSSDGYTAHKTALLLKVSDGRCGRLSRRRGADCGVLMGNTHRGDRV